MNWIAAALLLAFFWPIVLFCVDVIALVGRLLIGSKDH